ncbi:DgyrCDS6269 [Dimorphilus gyrociliatus]|uniref:DgyrCDS6269 n=1 Tax=Dimorphilus gyrociliatus TaxID=2664684 RepID=A0A7I8VSC9_9ANNE|nr:DgyrCDS6269 [Dimorphilus gyrociliatus]
MDNCTPNPPSYEEIFGVAPDVPCLPVYPLEAPPPYTQPVLEGCTANSSPPLAYADFLPKLLAPGGQTDLPEFEPFPTILEVVNDWLRSNQNFRVLHSECLDRKISREGILETESTVHHESANGASVFVRGLRLWLRPATEGEPPHQLGYVNLFPERKHGIFLQPERVFIGAGASIGFSFGRMRGIEIPVHETIDEMVCKFNQGVGMNPLPGKILNVDTVEMRHTGSGTRVLFPEIRHPDKTCWSESGNSIRFVIHCLKVFFIVGPPLQEEIAITDFTPKMIRCVGLTNPTFEKYPENLKKASKFIHDNQMAVTNIQTIQSKVDINFGECSIDSKKTDYYHNLIDTIFAKVIRVISITNQSSQKINHLSTKCFVPQRNGKEAQPMGQCIENVNKWLQTQNVSVIGIDTLSTELIPEAKVVNTDKSSVRWIPGRGHYKISLFRLYLNGFVYDPVEEVNKQESQCCSVA